MAPPRSRRFFPEVVTGYPLVNYDITLVQPAAAINLVSNPSLERDTTGWSAAGGAAVARSAAWQRRGAFSLAVTPGAGLADGAFFGTVPLTGGTLYAMSVDMLAAAGVPYAIYFANTIAQRLSPLFTFTGTGRAQRPVLNWQPPATSNYRCYMVKNGHASTKVFYVDGLQVEAAPASTYLDGDQRGFIANQAAYYWTATPHASSSVRILATRAGGVEVSLSKYGFSLLAVMGLGLTGFVNQFTPNAALGGSQYDGTLPVEHVFDLVGALTGRSHLELQHNRSGLERLLRPNAGILQQPLLMRLQSVDDCGDPAGETVEIPCTFEPGGLAGQVDNDYQERVDLQFKIFLPYVARREGEEGASLNYQQTIPNANFALYRTGGGQWTALGTGFGTIITAIAVDRPRGRIYFGGGYMTANGATQNRICYLDLSSGQFVAMDNGVTPQVVRAIAVASNGDVWIGGDFTSVGSAAAAAKGLARWNLATGTWTAFNPATASFNKVNALAIDSTGLVYVGGNFTDWNGNANSDNIVSYNGSVFAPLLTGTNSAVTSLAIAPDGLTLYIGGAFTTPQTRIMKWSGGAFAALGPGSDGEVDALAFGPDGRLYAGGSFAVTPAAGQIAVWNGTGWSPLGAGVGPAANGVLAIAVTPAGIVYAGGKFQTAGGLTLPDRIAGWNGSAWFYVDVDMPGATNFNALALNRDDLYVGTDSSGSAVASVLNTLTNTGTADAYPIFEFLGPGTVYQLTNTTTGDALYFNLTLLTGERATLDLRPGNLSFVSTFRGDIAGTILPGSGFGSWHLAPGANTVSAFISSVSILTTLAAHWAPSYLAAEDALYTP